MNDIREAQQLLRTIGWPIAVDGQNGYWTQRAVRDFQRGYLFTRLAIDGIAGPITTEALRASATNGGRCSSHFTFAEFRTKHPGSTPDQDWMVVQRELLQALEFVRRMKGGRPLYVVSGYRDQDWNSRVGGAIGSRHLTGEAADIPSNYGLTLAQARGHFTGIGINNWREQLVEHVDVRGLPVGSPWTSTSLSSPAIWSYNR